MPTTRRAVALAPVTATEGVGNWWNQLATFTDADPTHAPASYAAVINWGDGSPDAYDAGLAGNGSFPGAPGHTYRKAGSYPMSLVVYGPGGSAVARTTATVADAPLSSSPRSLTVPATHSQGQPDPD